eukprot:4099090-Prymnesium_polylepis.1
MQAGHRVDQAHSWRLQRALRRLQAWLDLPGLLIFVTTVERPSFSALPFRFLRARCPRVLACWPLAYGAP